MPSGGGCPYQRSPLAGVDHSHVQCSILPSAPVGEQHISRSAVLARDEEPDLPDRSQPRRPSGVVEVVAQVVMAGDALSARAAAHGVVALGVTVAVARWAGPLLAVERESKPVPGHHHKLLGQQV